MNEPICIESRNQLLEWLKKGDLLFIERWKTGVKRLHIRHLFSSGAQLDLIYCKDDYLYVCGPGDDNPAAWFRDDDK